MTKLQRIALALQKYPKLYSCLILPYYFARFLAASLRHRSLWFYRYPPGHYGSTIPSRREIDSRETELFSSSMEALPGIDLNVDRQLGLLHEFSQLDESITLHRQPAEEARYYCENTIFRLGDAVVLQCFLRHFRPRHVVEIGSGFSSAVMLDVRDELLQDLRMTFIEPYPARLERLMREQDRDGCTVIEKKVQDVPLDVFHGLGPNDILFVDSSHVLKIGSDLSTIFFTIFPALKPGVLVHIHDIFWPFEYPKEMLNEGRNWNEAYVARSFLQYNDTFEVVFFSSYLETAHADAIQGKLRGFREQAACGLWLRKK